MHKSFATIDNPEFINLKPTDISPLMASCEIKVLYTGENRNHSFISKDIATEMAKTLRGAPVIGYFKEEKGDFADHGEKIIFDDEGIHFEKNTRPYGFVPPDAKVWFQKFKDIDDFGNEIEREYLMTTGYLWVKAYPEVQSAVEGEGQPHSMELDDTTLEGHWAENYKNGMEFFIIDDATFLSLCILGKDVEPCFEGSSVKAPEVSSNFSKQEEDKEKIRTLFEMMQQVRFALQGGKEMEEQQTKEPQTQVTPDNKPEPTVDFTQQTPSSQPAIDEKKVEKEYTELKQQYTDLETKYGKLEESYSELIKFKNKVELERKQDLIKSFYMLSDEDKKDVTEHISEYSLEEIESKLSVICVRKKVNFNIDSDGETDKQQPTTTYSLSGEENIDVPAWVSAAIKVKKSKEV